MKAINPANWWHDMEGGKIAEQRPPPPGANAPYPNLATVPARPTPPDREALKKLTDSLVADRSNAQYTAAAAPLPDPSSPSASPSLFGVGTTPPPPPAGTPAASASLAAASAPPRAAPVAPQPSPETAPPSRAPLKAVQSAPLAAPAAQASAQSTSMSTSAQPAQSAPMPAALAHAQPTTPSTGQPSAQRQMTGAPAAPPSLPAAPPARPAIASEPAAPAVPPPSLSPMPPPAAVASTTIGFAPGSATLSAEASATARQFATKRGDGVILVTGHGDATSADPRTQTVAVSLGLSRAQAVANSLTAAGVPPNALRVNAEAAGRGVVIHLLQ